MKNSTKKMDPDQEHEILNLLGTQIILDFLKQHQFDAGLIFLGIPLLYLHSFLQDNL